MCKATAAFVVLIFFSGCSNKMKVPASADSDKQGPLAPYVVTDTVQFDSDDPAIWINPVDRAGSLIIGTDKDSDGGLFAFDLHGKLLHTAKGLKRPNNVDVAYALPIDGKPTDIAAVTERETNRLRVFALPALTAIDSGGIDVFEGEKYRAPMGIAFYTRASDGAIYAIVGRKSGPSEGYLWQYRVTGSNGRVRMQLVRKFGKYSGVKEIESIAVDNELGFVYYSDEQVGIRKYYADPDKGNEELAFFGRGEFREDCEGISIYKLTDSTGYLIVSDQGANAFNIYPREGATGAPHSHSRIAAVPLSTDQSDGSEVTALSLPGFKGGLFVAMSTNKTFQYYRWQDIARKARLKMRY